MPSSILICPFHPIAALLTAGIFGACFFDEEKGKGDAIRISVAKGDTIFTGAPIKVWAEFKEVEDSTQVQWKNGSSLVLRRAMSQDTTLKGRDTVLLDWRQLPNPILPKPGGLNDFIYIDTIQLSVDGASSNSIAIHIQNLFPSLDSIVIQNGVRVIPRKDSIILPVHFGSQVKLGLHFSDRLKPSNVTLDWPDFMKVNGQNPLLDLSDSTYNFEVAPTNPFDQVGTFRVFDGSGASKSWFLRYRTYQESGTLWVGTPYEFIKISADGFEIYRVSMNLDENLLMRLDKISSALLFYDRSQKRLRKFNARTFREFPDFIFNSFENIHHFTVNQDLWVAHDDALFPSESRLEKYNMADGKKSNVSIGPLPGKVINSTINTLAPSRFWFSTSKSDSLFLVGSDSLLDTLSPPLTPVRSLSYDAKNDILWISDGKSISALNSKAALLGRVTGFSNVVSLSAAGKLCWVADKFLQKVFLLNGELTEIRSLDKLGPSEFSKAFTDPVFVEAVDQASPEGWVIEAGTGSVVKLSADGSERVRFTGIIAPKSLAGN